MAWSEFNTEIELLMVTVHNLKKQKIMWDKVYDKLKTELDKIETELLTLQLRYNLVAMEVNNLVKFGYEDRLYVKNSKNDLQKHKV